jgi:hypothetical protein
MLSTGCSGTVESGATDASEEPQFAGLVEKDVSRRVDEGVEGRDRDRSGGVVFKVCPILFRSARTTCKPALSVAKVSARAMSSEPIVVNALSTAVVSL